MTEASHEPMAHHDGRPVPAPRVDAFRDARRAPRASRAAGGEGRA
jgi:hypothetical protein